MFDRIRRDYRLGREANVLYENSFGFIPILFQNMRSILGRQIHGRQDSDRSKMLPRSLDFLRSLFLKLHMT